MRRLPAGGLGPRPRGQLCAGRHPGRPPGLRGACRGEGSYPGGGKKTASGSARPGLKRPSDRGPLVPELSSPSRERRVGSALRRDRRHRGHSRAPAPMARPRRGQLGAPLPQLGHSSTEQSGALTAPRGPAGRPALSISGGRLPPGPRGQGRPCRAPSSSRSPSVPAGVSFRGIKWPLIVKTATVTGSHLLPGSRLRVPRRLTWLMSPYWCRGEARPGPPAPRPLPPPRPRSAPPGGRPAARWGQGQEEAPSPAGGRLTPWQRRRQGTSERPTASGCPQACRDRWDPCRAHADGERVVGASLHGSRAKRLGRGRLSRGTWHQSGRRRRGAGEACLEPSSGVSCMLPAWVCPPERRPSLCGSMGQEVAPNARPKVGICPKRRSLARWRPPHFRGHVCSFWGAGGGEELVNIF